MSEILYCGKIKLKENGLEGELLMTQISVLMTVYNEEKYIFEAIQSILNQTYKDFELIIIDDASTDKTTDIIRSIQDGRISLYSLPNNKGVGYANDYALQFAKGKYIAKMDADDVSHPERLAIQYEFLEKNSHVGVVDTLVDYFTESPKVKESQRFNDYVYGKHVNQSYDSKTYSKELYWFCNIVHSAVMYRRELINKSKYPLDMLVCEDYSYFYQMNKQGILFHKIPQILLSVRMSDTSLTAIKTEEIIQNIFSIKKKEIRRFIEKDKKPIVIWGAGKLGELTHSFIKINFDKENIFFVDSRIKLKEKEQLLGTITLNPNSIDLDEMKVFVASSYGKYEIVDELEKKGFKNMDDYFVVM